MKKNIDRKGFAVPLAIMAALSVGLFVLTLTTLGRNFRSNLSTLNTNQTMFNMAFSVYSDVLARIGEKSWDERFFKAGAFIQNNVDFDQAKISYQVNDTPGQDYQADLYIKVSLNSSSRVFFWRFRYVDDILD
ncbi:MAG: hypothetical protein AB1403_01230, partial [Candidatus Riflebacteria bacterium]